MLVRSEYVLTTDNTSMPVSTDEVNAHLKESFTDIEVESSDNLLVRIFIKAAEKFGEDFTRRIFLTKTYTNYREGWIYNHKQCRIMFELRRSKLIAIASVKYIDIDEVEQTIANTNYETTLSDEYSNLYFIDDFDFPSISSQNQQPIRIEFSAGYGATEASIPNNIKTAILNHVAKLWKQRGDCPKDFSTIDNWIAGLLPTTSRLIYSTERIPDLIL
jgi:uncharacterized phiE125 gp8 family phage protein